MLGGAAAQRLEAGLAGLAFEHPFAGEGARLDFAEDFAHALLDACVDDPRPARVVAVLGGVGNRIAHGGDAALVDQIDDQLDLVQALEIGHLRRVAGLDQGLVGGHDEGRDAAAEHRLLAEEVGLALLPEGGLEDRRAPGPEAGGIRDGHLQRVAAGILFGRHQARHAGAAHVFGAYGVARPLGRHHEDVDVRARLDEAEVDVQAVGEGQGGALLQVVAELAVVDAGLHLVGSHDHHHVGVLGGLGRRQDGEAVLPGPGVVGGPCELRDGYVLDAAVAQIEGVGMALAAVADDGHLLGLDQIDVGIAIVIDTHGDIPSQKTSRVGVRLTEVAGRGQWRRRRCATLRPGPAGP